ncbi:YciI family protein [Streptomyces niveus]|uniref:YciI family protein n=1 Tax=Streptomyces niveus TaxID=193462 RepID=UPI0036543EDE
MKYMLLMQFSAENAGFPDLSTWTPEEIRAHIAFMGETNAMLKDAGELVDAQGLAGVDTARIVRAGSGGAPVVTEGPFPETKEFLAGFWVVDCETPARADEIAAHISAAPGPGGKPLNMAIEARQIMAGPPEEL